MDCDWMIHKHLVVIILTSLVCNCFGILDHLKKLVLSFFNEISGASNNFICDG